MAELAAGALIAGRYELLEKLGQGGMATVWKAEHVAMRAPVAIKLIEPDLAQTEEARQRFLYEAQALAALRGPHVVQILDFGLEHEWPFIAMELLQGETLGDRLVRVRRLPPADVARIVTHVSRALTSAHERGIVHRDLTPHNVFLLPNDDEELAKVLDFGIAKIIDAEGVVARPSTHSGTVLGTPHYMSPEQAQGAPIDHRSDIWSLGIMTCECLTGRHPFEGYALGKLMLAICSSPLPAPSSLGPVPPGFDAWFARAAARDVNQRFQSAKQAAQALSEVCGSLPSLPAHAPTPEKTQHETHAGPPPAEWGARGAPASAPRGEADRTTRSVHPLTSSEKPPASAPRAQRSALALVGLCAWLAAAVFLARWGAAPGTAEPPRRTNDPAQSGNPAPEIRARDVSAARPAKPWSVPSSAPVLLPSDASGFVNVLLPALGVRIDVPRELTVRRGANRLGTRDGTATLTFTEHPPSAAIEALFHAARQTTAGRTVSYEQRGDTWFVVSGHDGDDIYYQKTLRHDQHTTSFLFRFPAGEKPHYAPLLEHMEDSFGVSHAASE